MKNTGEMRGAVNKYLEEGRGNEYLDEGRGNEYLEEGTGNKYLGGGRGNKYLDDGRGNKYLDEGRGDGTDGEQRERQETNGETERSGRRASCEGAAGKVVQGAAKLAAEAALHDEEDGRSTLAQQ
jgi:Ca2+-binding RTX toxin-like protein